MTTKANGYKELLFGDAETAALELIPYFTAPLSVGGSFAILWFLWWNHQKTRDASTTSSTSTYHRLMLGMSTIDLLVSLSIIILGPWVVPQYVSYTRFGSGTVRTCEVSGFFLNFTFGTMFYSGFLSLYFLILVRFEWRTETIRRVEPVAHVVSWLSPLATGGYALAVDALNPMRILPGWCWMQDYPPNCANDDSTECERGQDCEWPSQIGGYSALVFFMTTVIVSMLLIVLKVRHTELQLLQYTVSGRRREALERTRETASQAILYISAFFAIYFPIVMLDFFGEPEKNRGTFFTFALLTKAVSPMQGLFNAYIYLRKKFWSLTKEGECFEFVCKLPLVGGWFSLQSQRRNSCHRNTPTRNKDDGRNCQQPPAQTQSQETTPSVSSDC